MGLYKTFAKSSDLASFLHVNVEALTSNQLRLLDRANEFVSNQITEYDSTDENHRDATRLAVCSQVEYWSEAGERDNVKAYSLNDLSMTFDKANLVMATRTKMYLGSVGLLYRGITRC